MNHWQFFYKMLLEDDKHSEMVMYWVIGHALLKISEFNESVEFAQAYLNLIQRFPSILTKDLFKKKLA